jgi:hypothetical protein
MLVGDITSHESDSWRSKVAFGERTLEGAKAVSTLRITREFIPEKRRLRTILAPWRSLLVKRALNFDSLESRQLLTGLTPAQLRQFYGLNKVYNQNPASEGAGISIAVVVPYDNPTAAQDVANDFDRPYHLPALNLTTYNLGVAGYQPSLGWSTEAETDIEMIHTIAPLAHIDLVEAIDSGLPELMAADRYAASLLGVAVVSDSWGSPEFTTENQLDQDLTAPGVTFVAATGDNQVPEYPAVSPDVIAVGGTCVSGKSEIAWGPSGGGESQIYPGRQTPDVRMAVNSINMTGTSVSAPLFAGLVGIADALREQNGLGALSTSQVRSSMDSVYGTKQYHNDFNVINGAHGGHQRSVPAAGLRSPKAAGLIGLLSGLSEPITPHFKVKLAGTRVHR